MFTRISSATTVGALLLLGGCGERQPDAALIARVEAEQRATAEDGGMVLCARGTEPLSRVCTVERERRDEGLVLTLRRPDGGFRRLLVTRDGRGVIAADGAEPARVAVLDANRIDVALGTDRYRLPATVRAEPVIPIDGQRILTAAQMRAAEAASGHSTDALMVRAGAAIAEQVRRLAMGAEVLIVCGPGNNGGDGYVAATALRRAGVQVRVAADIGSVSEAARHARTGWDGPVEALVTARHAPVLVDALFGTGLSRPLDPPIDAALERLGRASSYAVAVDLPSGVDADSGRIPTYFRRDWRFDLTLALGAAKRAHVLQPSARVCGQVRILDIGLPEPEKGRSYDSRDPLRGNVHVIAPARLRAPGPDDHKYTRGMVAVIAGEMEGAARLAATAALRAGAGYVAIYGGSGHGGVDAVVHRPFSIESLRDRRIGTVVIGPGLGRSDEARRTLATLIGDDRARLVIDGDALHLLDLAALHGREHPVVLTPHAGEFRALFGDLPGSAIDRALAASRAASAIVVLKGATTVIAGGAGHAVVSPCGSGWLSTAGTGDVLAGTIAAIMAGNPDTLLPLDQVAAGVWLHAEAARIAGASFIADDLADALSIARASACR